jgi:hypothetical protein
MNLVKHPARMEDGTNFALTVFVRSYHIATRIMFSGTQASTVKHA